MSAKFKSLRPRAVEAQRWMSLKGLGRVKTLRRKGLESWPVVMQGFFGPDYALIAAISG
jgi:hypothetical protein